MSVIQKEDSRELSGGGVAFKQVTFPLFITTIFILQYFLMQYILAVSNDWLNLINFKLKQVKSLGTDSPSVFLSFIYMWNVSPVCLCSE